MIVDERTRISCPRAFAFYATYVSSIRLLLLIFYKYFYSSLIILFVLTTYSYFYVYFFNSIIILSSIVLRLIFFTFLNSLYLTNWLLIYITVRLNFFDTFLVLSYFYKIQYNFNINIIYFPTIDQQ